MIDPTTRLREVPCPAPPEEVDLAGLATLTNAVLRWRDDHPDAPGVGAALLGTVSEATLEDGLARLPTALKDLEAWRCIRWIPDVEAAAARGIPLPDTQIRLTKYLAWEVEGRTEPGGAFTAALYAVPSDEAGLPPDAIAGRSDLLRLRFTRKQVLDGVYEPGGEAAGMAEPLVWLRRGDVHEALMQGTVVVALPDGRHRTFNVHRNNAIPWDPKKARDPEQQDRLWYFREVEGLLGYGDEDKVRVVEGLTAAGDVENLGLGVPVLLTWTADGQERAHLVLVADTGGAFSPNLFQLDWLVGTFADRATFEAAARRIPDRVTATFLVPR